MKRLFIYKMLWLLLLLPFFSGCNDTDDVAAIFTGKEWKLNFIALDGKHEMFDFWDNPANEQKSMEQLNKAGTYIIRFEGTTEDDVITGQVKGKVTTSDLNGTWNANGKNNKFKATVKGSDNGDILATKFLEGLNAATSYEGDKNNLYLLYQSNNRTFRIVFRPVSNN